MEFHSFLITESYQVARDEAEYDAGMRSVTLDPEANHQQLNRYIEHARAGFLVIVMALAAIVIIIYGLQP